MEEGSASGTAEMVCFFRALDLQWDKENSLIKDEFARLFLSEKMQQRLPGYADRNKRDLYRRLMMYLFDWIILRHAAIDSLVRENAPAMPVVLLGAGYDSRALRLKPFLKHGISEVDFPATAEQKKKILEQAKIDTAHITFHSADLMQRSLAEILEALGLRGKQALIVWEGVTMYVTRGVIEQTIRTCATELAPGSVLVADYFNEKGKSSLSADVIKQKSEAFAKTFKSEPILFSSDPEAMRALALAQGAKVVNSQTGSDIAAKFGRSADFKDNGMFALAEIRF